MGEQSAWDNRTGIYLLSAACAEFIADIFLCPYAFAAAFPRAASAWLGLAWLGLAWLGMAWLEST